MVNLIGKNLIKRENFLELIAKNVQRWATSDIGDHSKVMNQSKSGVHNEMIKLLSKTKLLPSLVKWKPLNLEGIRILPWFVVFVLLKHMSTDYPTVPALQEAMQEQANAMGSYQKSFITNTMGNTYNPL